MTKLAIVSAAHLRHNLFEIVCRRLYRQKRRFDLQAYFAVCDPKLQKTIEECAFIPVPIGNNFVSDRFNAALSVALEKGCDRVVVMGSDDFLSDRYLETCVTTTEEAVGIYDLYFANAASLVVKYWGGYSARSGRYREPIGLGRSIRKDVFKRLPGGRLWPNGLRKSLDLASRQRLKRVGVRFSSMSMASAGWAMDIKTDVGITPLGIYRGIPTPLTSFDPDTINDLKAVASVYHGVRVR